jgi:hypothetical protein
MHKGLVTILALMVLFAWGFPAHADSLSYELKLTQRTLSLCNKESDDLRSVKGVGAQFSKVKSAENCEHSQDGHSHSGCHDCKTCSCYMVAIPSNLTVVVYTPTPLAHFVYFKALSHPFISRPYQPPRI